MLCKGPYKVKDTFGHGSKLLEGRLGKIHLAVAEVTMWAGIDNADNDTVRRATLDRDADLLETLRFRTALLSLLGLVQSNNHLVLGKVNSARPPSIAEPGATAAVGMSGAVARRLGLGFGFRLGPWLGSMIVIVSILLYIFNQIPVDMEAILVRELIQRLLGEQERALLAVLADINNLVNVMGGVALCAVDLDVFATGRGSMLGAAKLSSIDNDYGITRRVFNIAAGTTVEMIGRDGAKTGVLYVDGYDFHLGVAGNIAPKSDAVKRVKLTMRTIVKVLKVMSLR